MAGLARCGRMINFLRSDDGDEEAARKLLADAFCWDIILFVVYVIETIMWLLMSPFGFGCKHTSCLVADILLITSCALFLGDALVTKATMETPTMPLLLTVTCLTWTTAITVITCWILRLSLVVSSMSSIHFLVVIGYIVGALIMLTKLLKACTLTVLFMRVRDGRVSFNGVGGAKEHTPLRS